MTLKEALVLAQEDINDISVDWDSPLGEIYKLLIEAGKREVQYRKYMPDNMTELLPGETK